MLRSQIQRSYCSAAAAIAPHLVGGRLRRRFVRACWLGTPGCHSGRVLTSPYGFVGTLDYGRYGHIFGTIYGGALSVSNTSFQPAIPRVRPGAPRTVLVTSTPIIWSRSGLASKALVSSPTRPWTPIVLKSMKQFRAFEQKGILLQKFEMLPVWGVKNI